MLFMRVFMHTLCCWLGIRTFHFGDLFCLYLRGKNLLTAIHTRRLVEAMWEAEISALFILHYGDVLERVMRPAIAGVTTRIAHAN